MSPKEYANFLRKRARQLPEAVIMPVFRRRAFKVLEVAIQNTPVNFGALRNGWHVTIGTPSRQDTGTPGTSATRALRAAESVLARVRLGEGVWIQNNVPYALVYERGLFTPPDPGPSRATHVPKSRRKRVAGTVLIRGGYHVVAPQGMLADAVQQVNEAVRAGVL